jgi:N-acetylneuraminic acid mutarotase
MMRASMRRPLLRCVALLALAAAAGACGARSNLDTFEPASGPGGPPAPSSQRLVLFGGWEGQADAGDTWAFDGAAWTGLHPAHAPSARNSAAAAAIGARIVLFGGTNDGLGDPGIQTDTWAWSNGDWTALTPAHTPPGRSSGNAAALGGTMVLFSGFEGAGPKNDTWVWDGTDWSERIPSAPQGQAGVSPGWRNGAAMSMLGEAALLFGGYGGVPGSPSHLGDTWTWDGTAWTQQSPPTAPSAREWAAVATLGSTVVLFGGVNDFGLLGDTWTWDGTSWTRASPSQSPSPRSGAAAATLGERVILFGGFDVDAPQPFYADTWAWDGTGWTQLGAEGPAARAFATLAPGT